MKGRDMRVCAECGREYDALQEHECFFSTDQIALMKAAERAGMDMDEYMEMVIEKGEKQKEK